MPRVPVTSPSAETVAASTTALSTPVASSNATQLTVPDPDRETLTFLRMPSTRYGIAIFLCPFLFGGVVKAVEVVKGYDQSQTTLAKWTELKEQRSVDIALIKQNQENSQRRQDETNAQMQRQFKEMSDDVKEMRGDIKTILSRGLK